MLKSGLHFLPLKDLHRYVCIYVKRGQKNLFPFSCLEPYESENGWNWKGFLKFSSPTLCSSRTTQSQLPRNMSRQLLSISKDSDFTTLIGNMWQYWTTLCASQYSDRASSTPVCAHCLWYCFWAPLKIAWLHLLYIFSSSMYIQDSPCDFYFLG